MTERAPRLSVVIPALDEEARLPHLLADLAELAHGAEVIVADGGSRDRTVELARAAGARVVRAPAGRGQQLAAGAREARDADWLFFVHADCRLHADAGAALTSFVNTAGSSDFAHFRFALDTTPALRRFIEFGQRIRERWLGMPYGDQGLIVSRTLYDRSGGYPEWPIMEDVGIVDRLASQGTRRVLATPLLTSGRRYEAEGGVLGWLRNFTLIALYRAGVAPARLARWYAPHREPPPAPRSPEGVPRHTVAVFAKAPVPGQVKTRLAADVGVADATRIYRTLGGDTVESLRGGPYRLVVYVDPPTEDGVSAVRDWLGAAGIDYRRQAGDTLGDRMAAALAECLTDAEAACIVGTDIPGIDQGTVADAFRALRTADLVVGPATDGGYYLIGANHADPRIFSEIPGSTELVLARTLDRAAAIGLSAELLDTKTDVDHVADVPEGLLAG